MPTQTYFCKDHDKTFEISVPFSRKHPPKTAICHLPSDGVGHSRRDNFHTAVWRPSAPNFIVKEGTGAAKRSPLSHD